MNTYNAFTVETILTRYPEIRSIWDFGRVFDWLKEDFAPREAYFARYAQLLDWSLNDARR